MTNRILTTHVGSLPRPHDLLDLMKAKLSGQGVDNDAYEKRLRQAVMDIVKKQRDCGIDVVTDGEQSKPCFFSYVRERMVGFEPKPGRKLGLFKAETAAFPEYYAQYFKDAMLGGKGFHYGADVTVPTTTKRITVAIGKPTIPLMPSAAAGLGAGAQVSFDWSQ